ncbi:YybS family protein [Caloranaerobacter ferrireducens]|uniref:YybS family protein n=1 Tax=Caloranaerobacter ferrireducens TaxID=1323370 RepID=UPI00084DE9B0|nr:YybS family protein [Caloranaerobacter ferrireducens]
MNLNDKTKGVAEAGIITALTIILALIGVNIFSIVILLYPVPFIILGFRRDIKYSILSIIVSSFVLGILIDLLTGVFMLLLFGPLSVIFVYLLNKKEKSYKVLIITTVVFFVSILIVILLSGYIFGVSFVEHMELSLNKAFEVQLDMIKNMSLTNYEMSKIKSMMDMIIDYMIAILPAALIIFSGFVAYVNYLVLGAVLRRIGNRNIHVPRFKYFRMPSNAILGILAIFIATWIIKYFKMLYYHTIFLNVMIIVLFILFIQGLAVLVFYLDRRKTNKFIKGIILVLSVMYIPMWLLVSFIGFIDSLINFRKVKVS